MIEDPFEPRFVLVTTAMVRGLTVLEHARAMATAGVRMDEAGPLLQAVHDKVATPDEMLKGATLVYAYAWQWERRRDRSLSWEDAQTWRVEGEFTGEPDPVAEAEAAATVNAALISGLSPADAGELTTAQLDRYIEVREAEQREVRRQLARSR